MIEMQKVIIAGYDVITPYGLGFNACWDGLLNGQTAIKKIDRFNTEQFISSNAAIIPELDPTSDESLVMQMLNLLFRYRKPNLPDDTRLFLATTVGEIELLERDVLMGKGRSEKSNIRNLLSKVEQLVGAKKDSSILISAACASSSIAIARASMMISSGEIDCALIVACDCVSEFVFSGFSALMAMDKDIAKPFDKNRNGLSLGEAAGYILLMSENCSKQKKMEHLGEILGWGFSCDAYHMTGPSTEASGLSQAIKTALDKSGLSVNDIGSISAHGTGTHYNDAMEIKAFENVFGNNNSVPAYSIKGGTGHTLGTAGLLETLIALKSMACKIVLPTVNFSIPDDDFNTAWISSKKRYLENSKDALKANAGFGGINAALILKSAQQ